MSNPDIPNWIMASVMATEMVWKVVQSLRKPQTPQVEQAAHATQTPVANDGKIRARAWRFIRRNPSTCGMALIGVAFLVRTAMRPGPVDGFTVVVAALVAADLHATVVLWMLGGGDRTVGQIVDGADVLPVDDRA